MTDPKEKEAEEKETEQQENETDPHRGTARTPSQHKGLDPEAERNNDAEEYDDDGVEKEKGEESDKPDQQED